LRFTRRCEEAIPELEIALATNRNDPNTLVHLSMCKYLMGGSDREAIALVEQAIRLSPRDPGIGWWYTWIGFVHLLQSRVDEAIAWLEKARSLDPKGWNTHQFLAAAYGSKGELELARAELAEAKRLVGSDRYSSVARSRANGDLYTPALRDRWGTVYFPVSAPPGSRKNDNDPASCSDARRRHSRLDRDVTKRHIDARCRSSSAAPPREC